MGYLDSKGLERYTWNVRNKMAKNHQVAKRGPIASFCPAPETKLDPIVHFRFKEIPPAEGEKSPDNPSTIEGISTIRIWRQGSNLIHPYSIQTVTTNGITFTANADGTIVVDGTNNTEEAAFFSWGGGPTVLPRGLQYTISGCPSGGSHETFSLRWGDGTYDEGNGKTFTASLTASQYFCIRIRKGVTANNLVFRPQLNYGTTILPFEPVEKELYTISLGSTYYGGTLDVLSGTLTVNVGATTLDGTYNFGTTSGYLTEYDDYYAIVFYPGFGPYTTGYNIPDTFAADILPIEYRPSNGVPNKNCILLGSGSRGMRLCLSKTDLSLGNGEGIATVRTAMLQWLSQHPLTVVCPLEKDLADFTVQLDPTDIISFAQPDPYTPRMNTIYSDQESLEVKWIREDFVHRTGNEVIEGVKTFVNANPGATVGDSVTDLTLRNPAVVRGIKGTGANWTRMIFADKDGDTENTFSGRLGLFELKSPKANDTTGEQINFRCYKYSSDSSDYGKSSSIAIGYDKNGIAFSTAPSTSSERTENTDIITRDWLPKDTRIPQKSDLWNWQKTEKTGCATVKTVAESSIEPTVDFLFTETPPISGDKSPENQSTFAGVNEVNVTRCGKNIFQLKQPNTETTNGLTFVRNTDGTCTLSGTAEDNTFFYIDANRPKTKAGLTYTLSGSPSGSSSSTYRLAGAANINGTVQYLVDYGNGYTFTRNYDASWQIYIYVNSGTVITNPITFKPQLELGSTATSFETYSGSNYNIPLNGTYYGGSLNLATGLLTLDWVYQEVTHFLTFISKDDTYATLQWFASVNYAGEGGNNEYLFNSWFDAADSTAVNSGNGECMWFRYTNLGSMAARISLSRLGVTSSNTNEEILAAGNAYIEAHPLRIVFKTFGSQIQTIQLTPQQITALASTDKYTPRVNTIYTDAASVQVGYQRYADENAKSASKLQSSVSLTTNLASTTAISFDGSADQNSIPVSGVLSISNGGTGSSTQNFVDLSNSQVINGVKTFGSTIEGVVDRSIKDGSGNVIANTYATKATATSLADGLMSSTDKSKLDSIGTVFNFKGSVADTASLPGSGNTAGDAYLVQSPLGLQAWNGTSWVDIGSSALLPISDSEIDAVFA